MTMSGEAGLSLSLTSLLYAAVGWGRLDRWIPPLFTYCCGIKISDCLSARLLQKPRASPQFVEAKGGTEGQRDGWWDWTDDGWMMDDGWMDRWMDRWVDKGL